MRETIDVELVLLGGFDCLHRGASVSLPLGARRLLALLAVQPDGLHRSAAAERLWPQSPPARAAANLRSALWRGKQVAQSATVCLVGPRLRLAPAVEVDLEQVRDRHRQLLDPHTCPGQHPHLPIAEEHRRVLGALTSPLLPDWSEDWLLVERERWHQFRLNALETLAAHLHREGDHYTALQTALAAAALEPIRETAHRIVIEVHLTEGNTGSALRHYQHYRGLLNRELGVVPSARMDQLVNRLIPP